MDFRERAKDVFGQPIYWLANFESISDLFQPNCSIFLKHDLTLFCYVLFHSASPPLILGMINITDIRVIYPSYGYKFDQRVRVSYGYFHFIGVIPFMRLHGYYNHLVFEFGVLTILW